MKRLLCIFAGVVSIMHGQSPPPYYIQLSQQPLPVVDSTQIRATYTGVRGATNLWYTVIARYGVGNASPATTVLVPNTDPSGSVSLSWVAPASPLEYALTYDVIRLTSKQFNGNGSCSNCLVVSNTSTVSATDTLGTISDYTLNSYSSSVATISLDNTNTGELQLQALNNGNNIPFAVTNIDTVYNIDSFYGSTFDIKFANAMVKITEPNSKLVIAKSYTFTGPLKIDGKTNLTIQCDGGSLSAIARGVNGFIIGSVSQSTGTTITGCTLIGQAIVGTGLQHSDMAIEIENAPQTRIINNQINYWNVGIYNHNSSNDYFVASYNILDHIMGTTSGYGYGIFTIGKYGKILNNRETNIGRHGVYCSGDGLNGACRENDIGNNYISGTATQAISLLAFDNSDNPADIAVSYNDVHDNYCISDGSCIIAGQRSLYNNFHDNLAVSNTGYCFALNSSTVTNGQSNFNRFAGNWAVGCGDDAFNVLYAIGTSFVDNWAIGGSARGFAITPSAGNASTGTLLIGNHAIGNAGVGVVLGAGSINTTMTGNYLSGNASSDAYSIPTTAYSGLVFDGNFPAGTRNFGLSAVAFANLPPCTSSNVGSRAFISDASVGTFHAVAAGGGGGTTPVVCDVGNTWIVD